MLQFVAPFFIEIAEDGASELLYLSDDVPGTVVADSLHNIFQQPLQHDVSMGEGVDKTVDGLFFHLNIVQSDAEVGSQVQFTGKIAKDTLEKRVDGLYPEIVVIV